MRPFGKEPKTNPCGLGPKRTISYHWTIELVGLGKFNNKHIFLPRHFPRVLDMSKFKVRELSREFNLHYFDTDGRSKHSPNTKKPLVKYLDSDAESKFVLLTMIHDTDKLAVFTSWDQVWTVINDTASSYFCDVILFNGCFFAVDKNGRTVVVDSSSFELTLAASPVFGGNKKFLIESYGELLLVDMYLGMEFDSVDLWNFEEDDILRNGGCFNNEITYKIKVFELVEREKSWVEVEDLDDKLLFLGEKSTFSASASDILPLCGESVFFHGVVFDWEDLETMNDENLGVCDFMSGDINLVREDPEFAKLFWPPPPWITSESQRAEDHTGEKSSKLQKACLCNPNFMTWGKCYCSRG